MNKVLTPAQESARKLIVERANAQLYGLSINLKGDVESAISAKAEQLRCRVKDLSPAQKATATDAIYKRIEEQLQRTEDVAKAKAESVGVPASMLSFRKIDLTREWER
ncbi:MAG: hypothetical protein AABY46_08300 [Nitrospirota bacterium]